MYKYKKAEGNVVFIWGYFFFVASYTGSSSDEDEINPRDKNQVC